MNGASNPEPQRFPDSTTALPDTAAPVSPQHLQFGLYDVNFLTSTLRKSGLKVRLPYQSFQILTMLLRSPGQIVTREELRRELWSSDVFVDFERGLNSAMQRLRSALRDSPRKPRYIETLPKQGYRFIASVEPVPPDIDTNRETDAALTFTPAGPVRVTGTGFPRPSRWGYFATAVLIPAVLLAGYGWRQLTHRQPAVAHNLSPTTTPAAGRKSIAVLGFRNTSALAHTAWLSTAFTEMLTTEMAGGDHFRTVAEEQVARAKLELPLADRDSYAHDTLNKIRNYLGCDYVVVGSYLTLAHAGKDQVRLDARVQDATSGETVASVAVVGSQSDLFRLVSQAGEELRAKLGIGPLTPQSESVRAALPADLEAARLYSQGLDSLRALDNVAARDLLTRVVRMQPGFAPAYSALATAWAALGYQPRAKAAAQKAMDLRRSLPLPLRLEAEGQFREMNGEWAQAVEIYRQLQRLYPDNLEYGLRLARAQNSMGHNTEAAETLAALHKLPSAERDDPRIDLAEAMTAGVLSDYKHERILAETAGEKAQHAGARLLLARAKEMEGWALDDLGELESAEASYALAQRMFTAAGDADEAALVSMNTGLVLVKQGQLKEAKDRMEQAADVFRARGDQARLAAALVNLAEGVYQNQGEFPQAERVFREALAIFTQIGELDALPEVTYDIADVEEHQGKLRDADELLQGLVEQLRRLGKKGLLGAALDSLGEVKEARGDMQAALQHHQEAVALFRDMGDKEQYASAQRHLGKALLIHGDLEGARQALAEALKVDNDIDAKADAALDQVMIAEVSLEQGKSPDLETLRVALDELRLEKMSDDEIEAEIVLARELIQQQNIAAAAETLRRVVALSAKSHDPVVRFDTALATAHLYAVERRFGDSARTLRSVLPLTVKPDCVRCQLEARLELGEIEVRAENPSRGNIQLREVAEEAQRRGFGLIAQRAGADTRYSGGFR